MLRQAEALRNEAMDNGNINWDDNFAWFCDFLKNTLTQSGIFDGEKNKKLEKVLNYIKSNGEYAKAYGEGKITYGDVDILTVKRSLFLISKNIFQEEMYQLIWNSCLISYKYIVKSLAYLLDIMC